MYWENEDERKYLCVIFTFASERSVEEKENITNDEIFLN